MKKIVSIFLSIVLILVTSGCSNIAENSAVINTKSAYNSVHFIDVGQGDSILVESKSEYMLVDAGEEDKSDDVINYIDSLGINKLKYTVATHPHSDHIGGMDEVINTFNVENIIMPDATNNTQTFENLLDAVESNNVNAIKAEQGNSFVLGDFKCDILGPVSISDDTNNNSVVLKLTFGNDQILLTGDCEKAEEKELLDIGIDVSADLLKAGHHGSSTSSTEEFVRKVNPGAVIISCGKNNDYGHPHKETVAIFNKYGIEMYRTDEIGTVVAECTGNGINIRYGNIKSVVDTNENNGDSNNYILNTKSKKYHKSDCGSVSSIKNKKEFSGTADELKNMGYSPCGTCKP